MADKSKFIEELKRKISTKGEYIVLGKGNVRRRSNYRSRCYRSSENSQ